MWKQLHQKIVDGKKGGGESKSEICSTTTTLSAQNNSNNVLTNEPNVPTSDISWTLEQEISLLMRIKPHPR
jgi:hypothetical protein